MGRHNHNVHYEEDVPVEDWASHHTGMHVSTDGRRAVSDTVKVRPQKKLRRKPGALEDTFATWTPVSEADLDEVHAVADTVSSLDIDDDEESEGGKRKRYQSSVSGFFGRGPQGTDEEFL
jgi:urease accessory protein UreH